MDKPEIISQEEYARLQQEAAAQRRQVINRVREREAKYRAENPTALVAPSPVPNGLNNRSRMTWDEAVQDPEVLRHLVNLAIGGDGPPQQLRSIRVEGLDNDAPTTRDSLSEALLALPGSPLGHSIAVHERATGQVKRVYPKDYVVIEKKDGSAPIRSPHKVEKGAEVGFVQTLIDQGVSLRGCIFRNMNLSGLRARNHDLTGCEFDNVTMLGARLEDANLTDARVRNGSKLTGTWLNGATVSGLHIEDSDLSGVRFAGTKADGSKPATAHKNSYSTDTEFAPAVAAMVTDHHMSKISTEAPREIARGLTQRLVTLGTPLASAYVGLKVGASGGLPWDAIGISAGLTMVGWLSKDMLERQVKSLVDLVHPYIDDMVVGVTRNMDGSLLQKIVARTKAALATGNGMTGKAKQICRMFMLDDVIICPRAAIPEVERQIRREVRDRDITIVRFGQFVRSSLVGSISDDADPDIIRLRKDGAMDVHWVEDGRVTQSITFNKGGQLERADILRPDGSMRTIANKDGLVTTIDRSADGKVRDTQNARVMMGHDIILKRLRETLDETAKAKYGPALERSQPISRMRTDS